MSTDNTPRVFSADTEDALWQQVTADMQQQDELFEYDVELVQAGHRMRMAIDIDLGGGFEGGFETTAFTALVPTQTPLRFAMHEQDWVHEIGKLLGLTDIELGDPELDATFIITTNSADGLRELLLSDPELRQTLLRHPAARLALVPTSESPATAVYLMFTKDAAIVEPTKLREVYHLMISLLQRILLLPIAAPTTSLVRTNCVYGPFSAPTSKRPEYIHTAPGEFKFVVRTALFSGTSCRCVWPRSGFGQLRYISFLIFKIMLLLRAYQPVASIAVSGCISY